MTDIDARDEKDDTNGHRLTDVGEIPVEGGRRPMAAGDEDDVQGHKRSARVTGEDEDDVEGHKRSARVTGEDEDDVEGHRRSAR